jgi:hypothetical protein
MLKVLAIESPFLISFKMKEAVNACVVKNGDIYIYNTFKELIPVGKYASYIDTIRHAVREGRYEWTDFIILTGNLISKDYDCNILVDNTNVESFSKLKEGGKSKISDKALKLFNLFLRTVNNDNPDMVNTLEISSNDGFFRKEVEEIISVDVVDELSNLDKEIIVCTKFEGSCYIQNYVDNHLKSGKPDRFIDINYFFRRLFNLEVNNYISFEN